MLVELLVVVLAILTAIFGPVGAYIILVASFIAAGLFTLFITRWLCEWFFGLGSSTSGKTEYRGPESGVLDHARKEKQKFLHRLESMDFPSLAQWVIDHPQDPVASQLLCQRLKDCGDLLGFARQRERYLAADSTLDIAQQSMGYHQLADLYAGPLNQSEKACELLRTFIAKYPKSSEAHLTRERLTRLMNRKDELRREPDLSISTDLLEK